MTLHCRLGLLLALLLVAVVAEGAETLQTAPANPQWAVYRAALSRRAATAQTDLRHRAGRSPSPFLHPGLSLALPVASPRAALPASYDLRTLSGKLPPIRDQKVDGPCWAFASLASLESCLRPGDTFDASENNLKNKDGFDPGPLDGGDYWMATAYLARWSGPVSEANDPYQPNSAVSPANLPCRRHVQDVTYLPKRTSYTDNAVVKQFIMTRGALYCGMNWKDSYMNWATFAMYNPTTNLGAGHAVAVIGWNDAYAATNFPTPPPGPGAFLIRDSEGTSFLPEGGFWVSYYDKSLCDFACFARTEALTNYAKQYSYDPLGWVNEGSITGGVRRPYFANIFQKGATAESLRAVATHATAANTHYELKVYRNPTTSPVHGSPVATQTGTFTYAGFHTVVLSTPVTLAATDKSFSVVFRVTNAGTTYLIPLEYAYAGYSSKATAAAGQSYYSSTGTTWTDATTWKKTCNVCVKAYTNPILSAATQADPALSLAGLTATTVPGQGGAVVFTLSAPAVVEARVLNLAGRTVRPLCEGSTCKRGTNTLLWDGRNQTGARTPSGTYLVEVQARSANGTTRRALTTMPVAAGQTR